MQFRLEEVPRAVPLTETRGGVGAARGHAEGRQDGDGGGCDLRGTDLHVCNMRRFWTCLYDQVNV